jgi:hypothetical protein
MAIRSASKQSGAANVSQNCSGEQRAPDIVKQALTLRGDVLGFQPSSRVPIDAAHVLIRRTGEISG